MILDVMMPRVDGISLCKSIRENPQTADIKVLAITAFPEQDNVKKMYDAGADLCLIKPLQFEHFRLDDALESYRAAAKKWPRLSQCRACSTSTSFCAPLRCRCCSASASRSGPGRTRR